MWLSNVFRRFQRRPVEEHQPAAARPTDNSADGGETEARNRAILEGALDAIITIDADGNVVDFNPAAELTFGYDRADVIGREMAELIVPVSLRTRHREGLRRYLTTGEGPVIGRRVDIVAMRADGTEFPVELTVTPIASASRPMFTGYVRDLTERKRAERELQEALHREQAARAEAEAATRARDDFLAVVSHELRTPLTPILAWSRMLTGGTYDEETARTAAATIERNARAQIRLVEDLLEVSRIIMGRTRLDTHPMELAPVVHSAVESMRPTADAKQVRLEAVLDPRTGPVLADAERIQQIVWNLVANAIKYTPKGGHVQVHLRGVDSRAQITVSDDGKGIGAEAIGRVFERFWQADSSRTRAHGGLGLGLSIVRHLVELHGGSVDVASGGEDKGSVFTVRLPLIAVRDLSPVRPLVADAAAATAADTSPLTGLRILVVDDEIDTTEVLRALLSGRGAEVRTALSTARALDVLGEWRPDVLVSDIGMPERDGYDLIRAVRARSESASLPAIALTAYARTEDRVQALTAGYQMHVAKPVEPIELVAVIGSLARTPRSH